MATRNNLHNAHSKLYINSFQDSTACIQLVCHENVNIQATSMLMLITNYLVQSFSHGNAFVANGGMPGALDTFQARAATRDPEIFMMLHEVRNFCESNAGKKWYQKDIFNCTMRKTLISFLQDYWNFDPGLELWRMWCACSLVAI